jgi:hypothetical protein
MSELIQLTNRSINLDHVTRIDWYPPGTNNNRDWAASVYFSKEDHIYIQALEDVQVLAAAVGFAGDTGAADPDMPSA